MLVNQYHIWNGIKIVIRIRTSVDSWNISCTISQGKVMYLETSSGRKPPLLTHVPMSELWHTVTSTSSSEKPCSKSWTFTRLLQTHSQGTSLLPAIWGNGYVVRIHFSLLGSKGLICCALLAEKCKRYFILHSYILIDVKWHNFLSLSLYFVYFLRGRGFLSTGLKTWMFIIYV